jgi:hypothetical protein
LRNSVKSEWRRLSFESFFADYSGNSKKHSDLHRRIPRHHRPDKFTDGERRTISAAPPAETSNWIDSMGMVGMIIAHAPERNVPA